MAQGYLARQADVETCGQEHTAKNPFHVGYCRFKMRRCFHVRIGLFVLSQRYCPKSGARLRGKFRNFGVFTEANKGNKRSFPKLSGFL